MAVRDRPHRSELAVPGSNLRALAKAPTLGADVVFLDLEDAVAPDDKEQARENVIAALTGQDWSACSVSVRINGLDTHWCYRDIVEVVERAGSHLDTILIPKVGTPADVLFVAAAGNDASNDDFSLTYPASYNAPNLITVAATTNTVVAVSGGLSKVSRAPVPSLGAPMGCPATSTR